MTDSSHTLPPPAAGEAPARPALSLKPLMFETFATTLAMMSFVALVGPIARSLGLAPWQAGVTVTVSGIAWSLCARPWGRLSDRTGRRRTLLQGIGGFVLAYLALCVFVSLALRHPMPAWLAFAGIVLLRAGAGAFYAAVPATSAALVADHFGPDERAGAMAALGASSAIGMVVGPGLSGLLAADGLSTPLYATGVLPLLAIAVLWRWLPRTEHHAPPTAAPLKIADPRLRRPLGVAFVAMFCVAIAQVTVGFFALDRLQLPPASAARVAGIALTGVGVALGVAQALVRLLRWPVARFITVGCVLSALGFGAVVFAQSAAWLWAGYFVAAAGMGWVFPCVPALAANSVAPHEQGAAAGTLSAAQGLGMIVGPVAGTLVYAIDPGAPFVLIAVLLLAVAWSPAAPTGAGAATPAGAPAPVADGADRPPPPAG